MIKQPKFQTLLTQLSTNETLRKQYKEYPVEICKAFGLSEDETTQFQQLQETSYHKFAISLLHNRLSNAKEHIPGICELLGDELIDKFSIYCQRFPSKDLLRGPEEALQFIDFLNYYSDYPIPGYPYANEVIDYEQTRLKLFLEDPEHLNDLHPEGIIRGLKQIDWKMLKPVIRSQLLVKKYNYPVDEIIKQLTDGKSVNPKPYEYWILFVRRQTRSGVIVRRIKKSTRLLISKCNGESSIGDVIVEVRKLLKLKLHEHAKFEKECRSFLLKLANEGFLELAGIEVPAESPIETV